jgi:hypothetical protein
MKAASDQDPVNIGFGFERKLVRISLASILPVKQVRGAAKSSRKYHQIAISIREVGLIEPPVVARDAENPNVYLLLDGHLRVEVLKGMGETEVDCLISTDDEAYTYNRYISRLAAVQEHKMIVRAIEKGVPEDRIARALDINIQSLRRKSKLLEGICDEAAEFLKDKPCALAVFDALRQMTPARQIEAAEFMISAANYSVSYANALLAGTPPDRLIRGRAKPIKGVTPKDMSRIERELANLQTGLKSLEGSYGGDNLHLVVVKGYLAKLLGNARVVRYLAQARPEFLAEFRKIAELTSTTTRTATAEK